ASVAPRERAPSPRTRAAAGPACGWRCRARPRPSPPRPCGTWPARPSLDRCSTGHHRPRARAARTAGGDAWISGSWGLDTRECEPGSATPAVAKILETPSETNLVEGGLGAVDERSRLIRVPHLGVRLHRLLATSELGEDLPLLEPGARLDVARLPHFDRAVHEHEGPLQALRVERPGQQIACDIERARTDVPVDFAPAPRGHHGPEALEEHQRVLAVADLLVGLRDLEDHLGRRGRLGHRDLVERERTAVLAGAEVVAGEWKREVPDAQRRLDLPRGLDGAGHRETILPHVGLTREPHEVRDRLVRDRRIGSHRARV